MQEKNFTNQNTNSVFDDFPSLKKVEMRDEGTWREIKSFVLRTQGIKDWQIKAIRDFFPSYGIEFSQSKLDFSKLFGNTNPVVIEVGFGLGESTARIAKENPQINYIGIEVFLFGFSRLLRTAGENNITNLKIMRFDAVQVLQEMIADNSISGFHIFFPDPWPKKRQQKKRLIQLPFASLLETKLKKGGYIYCVTDWEEYAEQMLDVLSQTKGLSNPYEGFAPPRPWRPDTCFERKGLQKDYKINEVWFEKN